jgi:SAM-dependent methyltransferase
MEYHGQELETFALATNWKARVLQVLAPHITGSVLEVGAGIGETTRALRPNLNVAEWFCLEPDVAMSQLICAAAAEGRLGADVKSLCGTTADLSQKSRFDTILYIDVLEHIAEDRDELKRSTELLRAGGRLIVLSPAYQFLFSEFDRAVGHFRRYTKSRLRAVAPASLEELTAVYLDSIGLLASCANRFMLRQQHPTARQVMTWDRLMVPLSGLIDPLVQHRFGRSVIMIWKKPEA